MTKNNTYNPRTSRAVGCDARLRRYRKILRQSSHYCFYCCKKLSYDSFSVDHIRDAKYGGTNAWVNIVACCKRCNKLKNEMGIRNFLRYILFTSKVTKEHREVVYNRIEQINIFYNLELK